MKFPVVRTSVRLWALSLTGVVFLVTMVSLSLVPHDLISFVIRVLTSEATYVALGTVAAGMFTVWSKLKTAREKAELAAGKAEQISVRVAANTERADSLESGVGQLTVVVDGMRDLITDLQQERDTHKDELFDLHQRLREATKAGEACLREITELKTTMRELNRESVNDKHQITVLQTRVASLELEVAKMTIENAHLLEENRDLKSQGRRLSDLMGPGSGGK